MLKDGLLRELRDVLEYFERSTSCFAEEDAGFSPKEGMLTALQHLAHVPQTVDWFLEGATRPEGFDMDLEKHWADVSRCKTVADSRSWLRESIGAVTSFIERAEESELLAPLPAGPVMGRLPKLSIVGGIADHTAHHRGALTVYARLLGKVPKMPYLEM